MLILFNDLAINYLFLWLQANDIFKVNIYVSGKDLWI